MAQLVCAHNWEARISHGRASRAPYNAVAEPMFGLNDTDATAQALANMKSDEYTALLGENTVGGNVCQYLAEGHRLRDRQTGQT